MTMSISELNQQQCLLHCIDNLHDPIILPNNKEVFLGRGPKTKISDQRCSRTQVSAIANIETSELLIKQVGDNKSGVNGYALRKNELHSLKDADRLELLYGLYIYRVEFKAATISVKRPHSSPDMPSTKRFEKSPNVDSSSNDPDSQLLTSPPIATTSCGVGDWESIDNGKLLIFTPTGLEGRKKIAAYDLDHTIITTKNGTVFPKNTDDWKIAFKEVPGKLKHLWNDGYKLILFTNQAGIAKGLVKPKDFKTRIFNIITKLDVPIQTFVSAGTSMYRKPVPGMWNTLLDQKNGGVKVDMENSFYCGDAAGREAKWAPNKKKDFSGSDRLFALNIGIKFYTPEEHFLGQQPAAFTLPQFNPSIKTEMPLCDPPNASVTVHTQEVVLLVGFPGSGKSFFSKIHMIPAGYVHVNRDSLKSWQLCISEMEKALQRGKSVVIDNTNPDLESRHKFIDAANKLKVVCRCFVFNTTKEQSKHNNKFRELTDDTHVPVNNIIINMFGTKYVEPSINEGFSDIVKINFLPHFKNTALEKLYKMYLLDKY